MKKFILGLLGLLATGYLSAQKKSTEITDDWVEIRMQVTDFNNQSLKTAVVAEHNNPKKTVSAKTDGDGLAILKVKTGESYKIQIPGSDDYYEYEIPEFAISPVEVLFKFHPKPVNQVNVPITIFNQPAELKKISLLCNDGKKIEEPINNGRALLKLEGGKYYQLDSITGTNIENGHIATSESGPVNGYALIFSDKGKAHLQELAAGKTYLFFKITDHFGNPVEAEETIDVKDECSGKRSQWKTYPNGSIFTEIRLDENLWLSLKHASNVASVSSIDFKNDINLIEMSSNFGSSKQILNAMHEQLNDFIFKDKLVVIAEEDQKTKIFSDLMGLNTGDKNYDIFFGDKKYQTIPDTVSDFQKKGFEVLSVLNRNKNKWKNRVIVADARTTLFEGLKQLSYWRGIEENESNYSNYVICGNKNVKIKTAKGIRITDSLFNNMFANNRTGRMPSPLVKALIESVSYFGENQTYILVADASIPVSDLQLLDQLKVPVKIILCDMVNTVIDPGYFEIAMKTGGSLHTSKQDYYDLDKVAEGKIITIMGINYKKSGTKFLYACN